MIASDYFGNVTGYKVIVLFYPTFLGALTEAVDALVAVGETEIYWGLEV